MQCVSYCSINKVTCLLLSWGYWFGWNWKNFNTFSVKYSVQHQVQYILYPIKTQIFQVQQWSPALQFCQFNKITLEVIELKIWGDKLNIYWLHNFCLLPFLAHENKFSKLYNYIVSCFFLKFSIWEYIWSRCFTIQMPQLKTRRPTREGSWMYSTSGLSVNSDLHFVWLFKQQPYMRNFQQEVKHSRLILWFLSYEQTGVKCQENRFGFNELQSCSRSTSKTDCRGPSGSVFLM